MSNALPVLLMVTWFLPGTGISAQQAEFKTMAACESAAAQVRAEIIRLDRRATALEAAPPRQVSERVMEVVGTPIMATAPGTMSGFQIGGPDSL